MPRKQTKTESENVVNFQKVRQTTVVERVEPVENVIDAEIISETPHNFAPPTDSPAQNYESHSAPRVFTLPNADFDEPETDEPEFLDDKTRALQFLDNLPDNTQISVIVTRLPDAFNQKNLFVNPAQTKQQIGAFRWNCGQAEISELLTQVQNEFGGGNYNFKIHERGFTEFAWNETLADSPAFLQKHEHETRQREIERLKVEAERMQFAAPTAQAAPPAIDEIDSFLQKAEKFKRLNEVLNPPRDFPVDNQISINPNNPYAAALFAAQHGNGDLAKSLLDMAREQSAETPPKGAVESFLQFAAETFDNPERLKQIQQLVGGVFMMLIPQNPPQSAPASAPRQNPNPTNAPKSEKYLSKRERAALDQKRDETV